MSDDARIVIVFTARSTQRILREGGTAAWRLTRRTARRCLYAVCTRNAHHPEADGAEAHHAAFLIGRISDVVVAPDHMRLVGDTPQAAGKDRYLIRFSEYALLDLPNVWNGRNPYRYGTLAGVGIDDVSALNWQPMPVPEPVPVVPALTGGAGVAVLTVAQALAQAKTNLALTLGVPPAAIEITVRG